MRNPMVPSDIKLLLYKKRLQSKLNHTLKLSDPYLLPLWWSGRRYDTAHTTLLYKRKTVEIHYKIEDVCCILLSKHDIRGRDLIKCAKSGCFFGPKKPQRKQIRYRNDTEIYPLYREQSLRPTQDRARNKLINK
jgi:hypothetical protein